MKVSVIIPTYNRSYYVLRAINSVLAQTFKEHEIIVVDDGSTDETRRLLKPYSHYINYIYQDNAGPAAARNNGIELAKGEWLAFLDSDDTWLSNKLDVQLSQCINLGADLCFHDLSCLNSDGQNISSWNQHVHSHTRGFPSLKTGIIQDPYQRMMTTGYLFLTSTLMAKRSIFFDVGFFNKNFRTSEDLELFYKLAARYRVGYIAEPLTIYSPGTHRITNLEKIYKDRINAIRNSLSDRLQFKDIILAQWAKKGLLQEMRSLAGSYRSTKFYQQTLRTYLKYFLIKLSPLKQLENLMKGLGG
jgi:glycosyltransferase involved in cell wall biosynthesis